MIIVMILPDRIRELRESRCLTQDELAEKLGVDKQTVFRWEKGIVQPKKRFYEKLAGILGVKVDDLKSRTPVSGKGAGSDDMGVLLSWATLSPEKQAIAFAITVNLLTREQYGILENHISKLLKDVSVKSSDSMDPIVELARKAAEEMSGKASRNLEPGTPDNPRKTGA